MEQKGTVQIIAKQVGLSPVTVSRILVGKTKGLRHDAAERARRVEAIAAQLGYRPSAAARSIRTRRTRNVGLVITTTNPDRQPAYLTHQYETVLGVEETLASVDHSLVILRVQDLADGLQLPRVFRERMLDGMIVLGETPDHVIDRIRAISPVNVLVETNRRDAVGCISRDEHAAGRTIAAKALDNGYRSVIYLGGFSTHFSVADRLAGVREACSARGIEPFVVQIDSALSRPVFEQVVDRLTPDTAVLSYGVAYATRLAHVAASRRLVAGEDYGIAAAEELVLDSLSWPELARVRNDRWEMGQAAARMVLDQLEKDAPSQPSLQLPGTWVPGSTLGRALRP